ncbi:UDP-3-O-(3-hydroxymyristoyl)glucosamine N-acyltransferase [Porphyromonadaceae bacterium OttesenSCG-928-L07]|nr:UDP-3-O-(3-hydroxymyristoyl)glucosamine N-acyltransferase [Porphyromonadaceae bacterium OttesenSCG-928-L07]MDL2251976.1 UDP-3-O-(3-hydroxymyristoyl)glucosamine N-acyltransferase [Odoribacter sp. OttesenSCG-928-J03]MDL2283429.1 UDP-3-O-(3-hydroxymyristoyl)glucosamine N-acyltransferase [Odoribacter sp. OttesenSCG-928-G04]MDL2331294.1 UDP-3-O-(3-hydroxymyristoyl)glucosamine N-acyltransferase [Odoribacter sp. OttesenSCG-928-A06]
MNFKAKDIAALLNGVVDGDGEVVVNNVSKIEEGKPATLAFLANPKYEQYIYTTQASVVLVNQDFTPSAPVSATLIRVKSAYEAIGALLRMYDEMRPKPVGIEQPSFIAENATLGENLYVGAFAYIGKGAKIGNNVKIYPQVYIGEGVEVGENTVLYPGVKIYGGCKVGKSCVIHGGAVIGSDGFGFAPSEAGYDKIPQIGIVVLEDNVEIGSNTCIDRATMGATYIKEGVKLDNLIQIGHNVVVGKNTVIASQTGIAGSTKIGEGCMFGGQVGVAGHLTIANGVKLGAQAGVGTNIKADAVLMGAPAFEMSKFYKTYVLFKKLPELYEQLRSLQKEVDALRD